VGASAGRVAAAQSCGVHGCGLSVLSDDKARLSDVSVTSRAWPINTSLDVAAADDDDDVTRHH